MTLPLPRRSLPLVLLVLCLGLGAAPRAGQAEGEPELRRSLIVKTVEKARRAIVSIRTNEMVQRSWYDIWGNGYRGKSYERDGGLGSGAIFHPSGYVMTNAHVISRASKIYVGIPADEKDADTGEYMVRRALPLAIDIENDLAILRLLPEADKPTQSYPFISLGRSDDLMVGESVVAMGHPFRLGLTVTSGIIGALNRRLELGGRVFDDFMQVDAAINPGNSGGPLFDVTGRWIGVNTAIYNRALGADGIGFAIPADRVRSLIGKAFKRRVIAGDWMGLEFEEGPGGLALIEDVYAKGPARDTVLRKGDHVVSVNGKQTPTLYDVRMALLEVPQGSDVRLDVQRRGMPLRSNPITLRLMPIPTTRLSEQHLGFTARDTGESNGVLVTEIRPDSPASRMKLQPGDLVVGLGEWKVENTEDLLMFVQLVETGDMVQVKIVRALKNGTTRSMSGSMKAE
jgi:serine protease Do